MEPVSLAVGVLSLIGVFNDTLQFITYVEVARHSSEQHVDCKLRLRAAALRLARWGSTNSLDDVPADQAKIVDAELRTQFNEQQVKDAESYLSQIKADLETAKAISDRYESTDIDTDAEDNKSSSHSVCNALRRMSIDAKKHTLSTKAKWVIKGSRELPAIIGRINEHIKNLEDLFPLAKMNREVLALQQARDLAAQKGYALLVTDQRMKQEARDEAMLRAFAKLEQDRGTTTSVESVSATFGDNNSGFQSGLMSGGTVNFGRNP